MTDELTDYRLDRTGRLPLAFRGEHLAGVDGEDFLDDQRKNPRWHTLDLYRTQGGKYVLHVRYFTGWKEEVGHDEAAILDGPGEVAAELHGMDPTAHVAGFPEGPQFEKKQKRLLEAIRSRFDSCVSELFAQLGPEFSERVE